MVSEIRSQFDIGAMLHNISTITLTKAQKRWRLAYFSIYFSNTMLSIAQVSKKLTQQPISEIVATNPNPDHDHSDGFSSIDQSELCDLVKNEDLEIISKLNGVPGLAKALRTDLENGINSEDTERRKTVFGTNTYNQPPPKGFFHFVLEAFKDTSILILLACAVLSLGFGIKDRARKGWYERGSIFVGIFLVIAVSAVSEFRQERQFDRLSKISNNIKIDVIREGRRQKISIFDVVVGDVVVLNIGDQVPADGLFIDGHSLVVDDESDDRVDIDAVRHPFLISGSKMVDGCGRMVVISVGMNTGWGKKMMMMSGCTRRDSDEEQTPLRSRLNETICSLVKLSLAIASLEAVIIIIRYSTEYRREDQNGKPMYDWRCANTNDILESVTRDVSAIAEGLLLTIGLTLAFSIKGMMGDQAMVRNLSACEIIGSATVICTHKTGTLTMNQMKVTNFWLGLDRIEDDSSSSIDAIILQLYHQGVGLNTTGSVYNSGNASEYSGSPTEKAILSWAVTNLGMDIEKLKHDSTILHVETFNSEKKRSGVLIRKKDDNTVHVHWKGAAEMVLAMCSNYYQKTGIKTSLNHTEKTRIEKIIEGMAASSLRCIAFAHKQIPENELKAKTLDEEGLTLLGIVGIKDPCRPGVKEAIDTCRSAGVEIKMITGDNVFTAKAIATECGILKGDHVISKGEVVEGEEFRNYTDEERMEKVDMIRVMARSSPFDKLLMVQCLKKKGHVVAVTGDGTNDARALKEADIGLSMGIQGTEVAKESSDIVILDDNFASVVLALRWGRCVYNNLQKFIQFQLTANVAALVLNFIKAASSAGGFPFTTAQLLWIDLIINTVGVVALATEPPTQELTQKPPVGKDAPLITNVMWKNLLAQLVYQMIILLTFQFGGRSVLNVDESVNNTLVFNTFILCQMCNLFNSRKMNVFEGGVHKNMGFLGIVGMVMVVQVVMVEFLNDLADTQKLNREQWGICIAFAGLSWVIGWFVKLIPVQEKPFLSYIQEKISRGLNGRPRPNRLSSTLIESGNGSNTFLHFSS